MALRELVLKLKLAAFEKAVSMAKQVEVSVKKSGDYAKETQKQILAQLRERAQAAKILARGRAAPAPGAVSAAATDRVAQAGAAARVSRGVEQIGTGALRGVGLGALASGPIGVTALVTQALSSFAAEQDKSIARRIEALGVRTRIEVDRALLTFEQRFRADPNFRTKTEDEAGRLLDARRARDRRLGLAPGGRESLLFGEG